MDNSKGIYKLIRKHDNFPNGTIEYDFNNINGFSGMKVTKYLQQQGYNPAVTANDNTYNACLFALASNTDMSAILSLGMADFQAISFLAICFFAQGLGVDIQNSTQAENTEN